MPQPEEVDEINEFLLKRREKQRMGELPREDYTPGFAKKISSAIFGKPRVEEKPLLKSTQPTYASSQAQAAMRQQLDEIMESRPTNTVRTAYAAPTPRPAAPSSPVKPSAAPASASPKPAVPHYYSSMPYPPYIQRGLATLDKKNPTAAKMAGLPSAPSATRTSASTPAAAPRASVSSGAMKPMPWPASTPKTIERMTPSPTLSKSSSAGAPESSANTRLTNPSPAKINSSSNAPAPRAPVYGTPPISSTIPVPTANAPPTPSPAPVSKKESIPFWKKLFAKKENVPSAPVVPRAAANSPSGTKPVPYYAAPPMRAAEYKPLDRVSPSPATRDSSMIAPVARTTTPSPSPSEKKSPATPNTMLPAPTPPVPVVQSAAPPKMEKNNSPPASPAFVSARPVFTPPSQATYANPPGKTVASEKKISLPLNNPPAASQPYTPPWVARTTARETPTSVSSTSTAGTLPWKQPFGTEIHAADAPEKKSLPPSSTSESEPKSISRTRDDALVSRSRESASEEIDVRELEKPVVHDAALDEELSEEEALEKLPFEDVEGLSASDLDYLSKKEKEHRQAQEEKENDLGIPSELKSTLQRQSSQLQGALQPGNPPSSDEKQEILRRLKKMMEDEGHS